MSVRPKKAYDDQLRHAIDRKIEWNFSYAEWIELWLVSGKWEQRGKGADDYCVCRYGDEGPYSLANCRIDTNRNNQKERRSYTDDQAREMWKMYRAGGVSQKEVGEAFGVHQTTVCKILNGTRRVNELNT